MIIIIILRNVAPLTLTPISQELNIYHQQINLSEPNNFPNPLSSLPMFFDKSKFHDNKKKFDEECQPWLMRVARGATPKKGRFGNCPIAKAKIGRNVWKKPYIWGCARSAFYFRKKRQVAAHVPPVYTLFVFVFRRRSSGDNIFPPSMGQIRKSRALSRANSIDTK